jgi:tetratricopeptide (TPR) repeat protein
VNLHLASLLLPLLCACGAEPQAPAPAEPTPAAAEPQPAPEPAPSPAPTVGELASPLGNPDLGGPRRQAFALVEQRRTGDDPAGAYQAARDLLDRALEATPDDPDLLAALAHIWADEAAFRALQGEARQANLAQAVATYERALEQDPRHVRASAGLASLLMERHTPQDDARAAALFQRALQADPGDQHARRGLAEALIRTERHDEAEPILEALLAEHQAAGQARSAIGVQDLLGRLYLAQGETARAEAVLLESTRALEALGSERADYFGCPYQALGALYHQTGDQAKELAALKRLAELERNDPVPQRSVAELCASLGDAACAQEYTARAQALEVSR